MLPRILGWAVALGTAAVALVLVWPQAFGLQNQWVAAHVVALRGTAAAGGAVAVVAFLLLALARPVRVFAFAMAAVFALFAAGNVAVLTARGFGGSTAETGPDTVTVLSWNTLGEVPETSTIADLAIERGADIVVLPETTEPLGEEVAVAMREGGSPMWVHTAAYDDVAKARSTTILISPDLGDYDVITPEVPGPPGNTNTVPSVVADPSDGVGPRIVAVHAVAPIRWELRNWRSDLDWLAEQCAGDDVIMAGDFNATVDHFAGRGIEGGDMGRCADAAAHADAAGLGTWPTDVAPFLGSPIDHVMATPNWEVAAFEVLEGYDDAGSDHRPIVSTLVAAG